MRRNVQDARRLHGLKRRLVVALAPVNSAASGKSDLIARAFRCRSRRSGRKIHPTSRRPVFYAAGGTAGRDARHRRFDERSATMSGFARAPHLHPQEVAAGGEVARRIAFDQISPCPRRPAPRTARG